MDIFGWKPLVVVIRGALFLAVICGAWIGSLYFIRYVRPSNIKKLFQRDVAKIGELGVAGISLRLQSEQQRILDANTDETRELQKIAARLDQRLTQVEDAHHELSGVVDSIHSGGPEDSRRNIES